MQDSDGLDASSTHDAAAIDQDEEMEDLFGNTEERAASAAPSAQDSERLPSPERERRQALEYDEDEEPGQIAVVVREANVAFPNIPVPKTSNGENWVLRTPNYVRVDTRPFHHETYVGPEEEEAQQGESLRERSMTIKLNVENTLRWRWVKDQHGNDRKESNARVIRWSDGSLSLRLGKELFDISQNIDTAAPRPQQSQSDASGAVKSQGHTYLVAQHRRAQVLQVETSVTGYMSLQPTGMQSETHRMLVRSVGQKHNKVARLRMVAEPTVDPERQLQEMMKAEAKRSKKRTSDVSGKQRRSRRSRVKADIWSDEDDDGAAYPHSDEDEDTRSSPERRRKRRHTEVHDEENRGGGNYQEDDFVVADTSDDDHGDGRRRRKRDEEMEEDPLDKLDSKIEEQENQRRNQRAENADDKMDVESEEEEDEFRVRRSGTSGRRKRAIDFEDEEDE